ncbi:hypothetical protein [Devosia sp.]|uniref:hypothetical protein n=1 Tax=Devosia sp. TaxID=1871048 RepID=UPI003F6EB1D3
MRARPASPLRLVRAVGWPLLSLVRRIGRFGADNIWRQMHRLDRAREAEPNKE